MNVKLLTYINAARNTDRRTKGQTQSMVMYAYSNYCAPALSSIDVHLRPWGLCPTPLTSVWDHIWPHTRRTFACWVFFPPPSPPPPKTRQSPLVSTHPSPILELVNNSCSPPPPPKKNRQQRLFSLRPLSPTLKLVKARLSNPLLSSPSTLKLVKVSIHINFSPAKSRPSLTTSRLNLALPAPIHQTRPRKAHDQAAR
ncbi:hypothetical protein BaRGS_00025521 [Batillaria attramentaria]|uniref:Uncharacterized protein n=1 Tax=Batillaria attramentaria TaxID=370345 RepID=A0ABD0K823_9CAEN